MGDVCAEHGPTGVVQVGCALAEDRHDQHAAAEGANELSRDVRHGLDQREATHRREGERDGRVDVGARGGPERVDRDRDHERERKGDDAQAGVIELAVPKPQGRHDSAGPENDEKRRADGLGQ
jgi:hypothetical protein